jgi:DNA gyrase subunit A
MEHIEKREISQEMQESYLDYAMSVIVSRALPDVRDGLKPVQRRILYTMHELGLTHLAKFRKCAKITGDTTGNYHPHGTIAVYDAMARMAQEFSLRYPLVIGQGNFGSVDGDPPAAERYTEAKLSAVAEELLTDIDKETVDWQPNYDAVRMEPKYLPGKLPNLLLNGAVGIAVGMATNIPPHNLTEIVDATLHLIENPDASPADLMEFIKGPDFPTGGIIYDKKAITAAYVSGKGAVTMRAKAEIVGRKGGKGEQYDIAISEIPYQVNKSELIIKIADLVQAKKIEGIRDIRDESDKDGLSIIIELKNDAPPQKVLNQLYQYTDLQRDFHMNMLALKNGLEPQVMSIRDILGAYVEHRKIVIRRRAEFDLRKAEERAHILTGLAKALDSIDAVINTIRKSADKDDARANLMKKFKFTEIQANAILEMRLQTLAALEREKIDAELKEKKALIEELQLLLKTPKKILGVIGKELGEIKTKYGDERRTRVVATGLKEFHEEDLIPEEDAIITISESGNIKRVPPTAFKTQHRGGKGLIGSDVAEEDFLRHFLSASTHDNILFFTDHGRVFQTKVHEIPEASRTAKGKSIHNFLEIPVEERVSAVIAYGKGDKGYLAMVTKDGVIKKTALEDFGNVRRTGIIAIRLNKGDALRWVKLSSGSDEIIVTTAGGMGIRFKESQIRAMGRGAAGVRAIRLKKGDTVSSMDIIYKERAKDARLLAVMANGYGKQTKISEYKVQNRGGSGVKAAQITAKTGPLVSAHLVSDETELFALSEKGQIIRTSLESVRVAGRATQGVRIMNLHQGDHLTGVICL